MMNWQKAERRGVIIMALALSAVAWSMSLAPIRAGLAIEYAKAGSLPLALEEANAAIVADPNYVAGWLSRAWIYVLLNREQEADNDYRQALTLLPSHPEANNNYGAFLCDHGQPNQALAFFYQALMDPMYATPEMAWTNIGRCRIRIGEKEAANEALLAALVLSPDYLPALRALALLHLEWGNVKLSVVYFDRLSHYAGLHALEPEDLRLGIRIARLMNDLSREKRLTNELIGRYPASNAAQQLSSGTEDGKNIRNK